MTIRRLANTTSDAYHVDSGRESCNIRLLGKATKGRDIVWAQ